MNCTYFDRHIELLFDSDTPNNIRREMLHHAEECPSCAEHYRQTQAVLNAVTPHAEARVSESFTQRVLQAAAQTPCAESSVPKPRRRFLPLLSTLSAAAMIALVLLLFNPLERYQAHAAGRLFRDAAAQMDASRSFYLEMDVRTLPYENFAYINADVPFVIHRMWVESGAGRMRLEKEDRIVLNDGQKLFLWSPSDSTGSIHRLESGVLEDFATLLDPYTLLRHEEAQAAQRSDVVYTKQVEANTITLTAEMPAQGDFSNDCMRNTTITESDTHREYRFDRATGRLIGLKIDLIDGKETKTIAELREIGYDAPLPDSLFTVPDGIEWNDLTLPVGGAHFTGITPKEATRKLFAAVEHWNEKLLAEVLVYYNLRQIKETYAGYRLVEMGEPFRSGLYPGVFVPCVVLTPNGKTERIQLALRNDNPTGSWVVDGGI